MNSFRNIYASDLSHRARSVYMYLKDRADSEGRCWTAPQRSPLAGEWESYFQSVSCGMTEVSNAG